MYRQLSLILILATLLSLSSTPASHSQTAPPIEEGFNIELLAADAAGLRAHVDLPTPIVREARSPDGTIYHELLTAGSGDLPTGSRDDIGRPAMPTISRLVALPIPAGDSPVIPTVRVTRLVTAETRSDLLLYPIQPAPVDQAAPITPTIDYGDQPFMVNEDAYRETSALPTDLVSVQSIGRLRDLDLARVTIFLGRYAPASHALTLYSDIEFALDFQGGSPFFLPERARSPFERHYLPIYDMVVNAPAVATSFAPDLPLANCVGYEYLIITAPSFRPEADKLAAHKLSLGIATRVVETGNGAGKAGTTREQIRSFIRDVFNSCQVRPSYLLLFGDAEHIPTWYPSAFDNNNKPALVAGDLPYAETTPQIDDTGTVPIPDLAYGRIPVDTTFEARAVVDKIIAYENNPPTLASYYQKASIASYFQCCDPKLPDGTTSRDYLRTAESLRTYLVSQGYQVDRLYNTNTVHHSDPKKGGFYDTNLHDATPRFYRKGAALPADLGPNSSFAWDADAEDISTAINAGRFLVIHRDHGNTYSWGNPPYGTGDMKKLTNTGLYPVVFSVDCLVGYFDEETDPAQLSSGFFWAESLLQKGNSGAAGVIAATRESPTGENDAIAQGLLDSIWPQYLPAFGSPTSHRRLGDVLNHSKFYLLDQFGQPKPTTPEGDSPDLNNIRLNFFIYQVFGDPTLEIWTSNPNDLPQIADTFTTASSDDGGIVLRYPIEDATITLLQGDAPFARTQVANGRAELKFINQRDSTQPLVIIASVPGRQPRILAEGFDVLLPVVVH